MSWLALEGKTAVVTGGASGIGKAVVQAFLDNGANVVVCDMNPQTPEYDLHEGSGEFLYVPTDVTKADSVKAMVEAGKAKFGKLDILVNNAGINIPRLLVDKDDPYGKYELDENVFDKVSAYPDANSVSSPIGEYFFSIISPSLSVKISNGAPSFILKVFLISFGITTLPKSSILLTTPVAFIYFSSLILFYNLIMSKKEKIIQLFLQNFETGTVLF